jgi:hypothetical protein
MYFRLGRLLNQTATRWMSLDRRLLIRLEAQQVVLPQLLLGLELVHLALALLRQPMEVVLDRVRLLVVLRLDQLPPHLVRSHLRRLVSSLKDLGLSPHLHLEHHKQALSDSSQPLEGLVQALVLLRRLDSKRRRLHRQSRSHLDSSQEQLHRRLPLAARRLLI